ncbi:hypothetical protein CB1_000125014 [Camelus ferus]|nr:hypothetical protein CB1_000125014 [Camelus ferus]
MHRVHPGRPKDKTQDRWRFALPQTAVRASEDAEAAASHPCLLRPAVLTPGTLQGQPSRPIGFLPKHEAPCTAKSLQAETGDHSAATEGVRTPATQAHHGNSSVKPTFREHEDTTLLEFAKFPVAASFLEDEHGQSRPVSESSRSHKAPRHLKLQQVPAPPSLSGDGSLPQLRRGGQAGSLLMQRRPGALEPVSGNISTTRSCFAGVLHLSQVPCSPVTKNSRDVRGYLMHPTHSRRQTLRGDGPPAVSPVYTATLSQGPCCSRHITRLHEASGQRPPTCHPPPATLADTAPSTLAAPPLATPARHLWPSWFLLRPRVTWPPHKPCGAQSSSVLTGPRTRTSKGPADDGDPEEPYGSRGRAKGAPVPVTLSERKAAGRSKPQGRGASQSPADLPQEPHGPSRSQSSRDLTDLQACGHQAGRYHPSKRSPDVTKLLWESEKAKDTESRLGPVAAGHQRGTAWRRLTGRCQLILVSLTCVHVEGGVWPAEQTALAQGDMPVQPEEGRNTAQQNRTGALVWGKVLEMRVYIISHLPDFEGLRPAHTEATGATLGTSEGIHGGRLS